MIVNVVGKHLRRLRCALHRLSIGPGAWGDLVNFLDGHLGQTFKDIFEIGIGIDAVCFATLQNGVDDGTAPSGILVTDEHPVFAPQGSGSDGIFDKVVIDLHLSLLNVDLKSYTLAQGVSDSGAGYRLRFIPTACEHSLKDEKETIQDWLALPCAYGRT